MVGLAWLRGWWTVETHSCSLATAIALCSQSLEKSRVQHHTHQLYCSPSGPIFNELLSSDTFVQGDLISLITGNTWYLFTEKPTGEHLPCLLLWLFWIEECLKLEVLSWESSSIYEKIPVYSATEEDVFCLVLFSWSLVPFGEHSSQNILLLKAVMLGVFLFSEVYSIALPHCPFLTSHLYAPSFESRGSFRYAWSICLWLQGPNS